MKVLAGIVTYNPDINRLRENIEAIINQVAQLIIVDNGSNNIMEIKNLADNYDKCYLLDNRINVGIAKALNQIMRFSISTESDWTLTLDQDTICKSDLINKYTQFMAKDKVGMITSLYKDMNIDNIECDAISGSEYEDIKFCITSGSLLRNNYWKEIGGFDEYMFIDKVDNDICLKLINAGYQIIRVNKIGFFHEVGHARQVTFFGKKCLVYNHVPFRRYYISRNTLYLAKKYSQVSFAREFFHVLFYALIVLIYENNKLSKLGANFQGVLHGLISSIRESDYTRQKINIVIPSIGLSGGIRVVLKYAELLIRRDYDVEIFTPVWAYNLQRGSSRENLLSTVRGTLGKIYHLILKKDHLKLLPNKIIRPVFKINNKTIRDAEICIATAWPTAYDVNKLSLLKGKKVYFIQDYEIWDNAKIAKKTYTFDMRKIVVSSWINQQLKEQRVSQGEIIFNGIDLTEFCNTEKKYVLSDEKIKCLMLYHNLEKKGVSDGIAAFEHAKKECPNIELTMFGMNKPSNLYYQYNYINDPEKNELRKLYCESDIFIFPSKVEGWGLTPIEAMACKCAVVGTNTGCLVDIGDNNKNSLITEPEDFVALGNSIIWLVKNDFLRKEISQNGYLSVKQLSWELAADKFAEFLQEVLFI